MDNNGAQKERDSRKVTVYIWTSTEKNRVGHGSIQVADNYFSLWPGYCGNEDLERPDKQGLKFGRHEASFLPNYETDQLPTYEGKKANAIFTFYNLDTLKMLTVMDKLKSDNSWWSLFEGQDSHSCTSAVWYILREGGIEKYTRIGSMSIEVSKESGEGSALLLEGASTGNLKEVERAVRKILGAGVSWVIKSPDMLARELEIAMKSEQKMEKEKTKDGHSSCEIV